MRADAAAKLILTHLLHTMEANEAGVREDLDSEFLHDFRVAIRRTRSGLSQIKDVLPKSITREFAERFANLGSQTNRLRDLDVYLLQQESYRRMLGPDIRPALAPLFDELARQVKR